jgi:uncharacterized membrane protein (DUF2068 family)
MIVMSNQRPPALLAIIIYKCFVIILLSITAIASIFVMKNHEELAEFSNSYVLKTKFFIIEWLVNKLITIDPSKLKLSGIVAGAYALVTAIEAIGLWYQQSWAMLLVLGLVGISIPPEIFELIKGITVLKLIIFSINIAMFLYLLRHVIETRSSHR